MAGGFGDLTGLMELRGQLLADAALDGFFLSQYGKSAGHIVGLRPQFAATDYPFLCYVPNEAQRGGLAGDIEVISLIIGVYDPAVTDGVSRGLVNLSLASARVFTSLNSDWMSASTSFLGTIREASDVQVAHPAYRKELQIPLRVRCLPRPG